MFYAASDISAFWLQLLGSCETHFTCIPFSLNVCFAIISVSVFQFSFSSDNN